MDKSELAKFYFNEGISQSIQATSSRSLPLNYSTYLIFEKAIENFNEALSLDSSQVVFWNAKAHALRLMGRPQDALGVLDDAIQIDPKFSENYYQASLCFFDLLMIPEAVENFEIAINLLNDRSTLEERLCADIYEIINQSLFYHTESKKLAQSSELDEMGEKIINLARFAVTFLPRSNVFPVVLNFVISSICQPNEDASSSKVQVGTSR